MRGCVWWWGPEAHVDGAPVQGEGVVFWELADVTGGCKQEKKIV